MKTYLIVALALFSTAAGAQAPAQGDLGKAGAGGERPWARGVTPEHQQTALALFRDGNGLLKDSLFVQAAAKYREALGHWDHPAIHYNLALALLNLDQPVEVFNQLEEAMKYGSAPLDADKFEHATRYKALIEKQVARVEVSCKLAGAAVTMDGRPLFTGPGRWAGLVREGQHTVVATRPGYVATQKSPTLLGGQKTALELNLFTAEDLTQYRRRWSAWKPWVLVAGGIALAGVGGILQWQAAERFKSFDAGIVACGGCVPSGDLAATRNDGSVLQAMAFVGYGLGAAAIAAGGVLVWMNRALPYRVSPEHEGALTLAPWVAPGGGGFSSIYRF